MVPSRYLRLFLSYAATAIAAGYCSSRGHAHISFLDPGTWLNLLQYRCGRAVLVFGDWTVVEMLIVLLFPAERDRRLEEGHEGSAGSQAPKAPGLDHGRSA